MLGVCEVDREQVDALALALASGALAALLRIGQRLRREGHDRLPLRARRGEPGDDVGVLDEVDAIEDAGLLGELLIRCFSGPVVRDGSRHDHDVGGCRGIPHRLTQLRGRADRAHGDARMPRLGEHVGSDVRCNQFDIGAAGRRLGGERDSLPSARAVAEEPHRIDGFAGATRRHDDAHPHQILRRQQREGPFDDHLGLEHPPRTGVTTGQLAVAWAEDADPALAQGPDVGLSGRMPPHLGVHRRRDRDRCRRRQQSRTEKIVGEPSGHLRDGVRGGRRDDDEFCRLTERDVPDLRHVIVHARGDGVAADRLPRRRADETQCILRGDHRHVVTRLDQQSHQIDRLVRGDAA